MIYALPILLAIACGASLCWLASVLSLRYGGNLGYKLTRPIGSKITEPAKLQNGIPAVRIGHDASNGPAS
jgi:hypothetical protein